MRAIALEVCGDTKTLFGFNYFWLKYVHGFDDQKHCHPCLRGDMERQIRKDMLLNCPVTMTMPDRARAAYLCGGAKTGYKDNLHLPMEWAKGSRVVVRTFNGLRVVVQDAREIKIPVEVPERYRVLPDSFTTCRNFRFGASYFSEAYNGS